jgi:hypothetical protein
MIGTPSINLRFQEDASMQVPSWLTCYSNGDMDVGQQMTSSTVSLAYSPLACLSIIAYHLGIGRQRSSSG